MFDAIVKDIAASVKDTINQLGKSWEEKLNAKIELLSKRFDELPTPKDGEDGKDGESITIDELMPQVEHAIKMAELDFSKKMDVYAIAGDVVDEAIKKLPKPDISDLIKKVDDAIKSIPAPDKPLNPPTPEEVALSMKGLFSEWALSFERNANLVLQKAVDNIPKPKDGEDGRDALDLEDLSLTIGEDKRTVTIALKRGETVIEKSIKLATIIDKGVYKDEGEYEQGDAVTFGGCLWIAQKDAPKGKPGTTEDFRMAVKRGRDGKTISGKSVDVQTVKIK